MIGFAYRTPEPVCPEECNDMVLVWPRRAQIQKKRLLPVIREHGCREEGSFKTVRRFRFHHAPRRHIRLAAVLVIYRQLVEIILNFLRSREFGENLPLGRGEECSYLIGVHKPQYIQIILPRAQSGYPGELRTRKNETPWDSTTSDRDVFVDVEPRGPPGRNARGPVRGAMRPARS